MERKYHADFIRPKPSWMEALGALRVRLWAYLTDVLVLFYLITLGTFCVTRMLPSTAPSYLIMPWWVLAVLIVEGAVAWETFGVSLGMRMLGLRLADTEAGGRIRRRIVRYFAWHLSLASIVGSLRILWDDRREAWHDRISRTALRPFDPDADIHRKWHRTSWGAAAGLLLIVTFIAGVFITKIDLHALFTGAGKSALVWRGLLNPDWSELGEGIRLLTETIFMALMATLFAVVISVPLSFLAARNLAKGPLGRAVYTFLRVTMSIIRSIEPIVWAIVFLVVVMPRRAAFAGVLALWVHSIADLTKLYSERLESIDPGPAEAVTATGANRLQVIQYGIVPQIVNPYLSFTLYRWDINVRMATIIGVVGGGGIGQMLYQYTRLWYWRRAGLLMFLIILTVWAMDYLSSKLRARLE